MKCGIGSIFRGENEKGLKNFATGAIKKPPPPELAPFDAPRGSPQRKLALKSAILDGMMFVVLGAGWGFALQIVVRYAASTCWLLCSFNLLDGMLTFDLMQHGHCTMERSATAVLCDTVWVGVYTLSTCSLRPSEFPTTCNT